MAAVLGVRTEYDDVLGVIAPLGLAAAAGVTCLVVDLDTRGPAYPGERALADLVAEGPRRIELAPSGGSVAVLRNGGVDWRDALETIERLRASWPGMVLRAPREASSLPWPVIPVVSMLPGVLAPTRNRPAVWQLTDHGQRPPGPGPTLPPLRRSALTSLLQLRLLPARRWTAAWRTVWELPWP